MVWVSSHYVKASFEVVSDKGDKTYMVSWGANQFMPDIQNTFPEHSGQRDWSCTCKDFKYNRVGKGGYCKHIKQVIDRRVLWSTDNEEDTIMTVNPVELTRMRALAFSDAPDLTKLLAMAQRVAGSVEHYAPIVGDDSNLIPVIKVGAAEFREIKAGNNDIVQGGELDAEQFGMLVDYILDAGNEPDNLTKCVVKGGFYPDANYTLKAGSLDMSSRCPSCGAGTVQLNHKGGQGFVCVNSSCERSPNHPDMIRNRRIAIAEKTGAIRF